MNGAQLHLALNHIPVILSMVSLTILLWGYFNKNLEVKKIALTLAVATAAFAGVAYLTGDPAEDVLKKLPDFSKELVHEHEEAGETALIISIASGFVALAALYLIKKKHKLSSYAVMATVLLILISSLAFLRTAHLGGFIRHEEIRTQVTR